jgi:hypothetical protein
MYYIMRLSGGAASAVACDIAIQRLGRKHVGISFQNTCFEDEDTYRFIGDCLGRWDIGIVAHGSGMTPLDVFEKKQIIPNSSIAPCSKVLKINPFGEWLWRVPKPVTILSGLGWTEMHRIDRILHYHKRNGEWKPPVGFARRISGVYEDFPLLWKPIEFRPYVDVIKSWGIKPPRAYILGFPHNNCGGRCIRQGASEWRRLSIVWPDRFAQMRDWEQTQRAKGGARANATICRIGGENITLAELEQKWKDDRCNQPSLFESTEDAGSCMCEFA